MLIVKKWDGSNDWIDLVHDKDMWRAFVVAAMNLRFLQSAGIFMTERRNINFPRRAPFH